MSIQKRKILAFAVIAASIVLSVQGVEVKADTNSVATYKWQANFYEKQNNFINVGIYNGKIGDYYQSTNNKTEELKYRKKAETYWVKAKKPTWAKNYWDANKKRIDVLSVSSNLNSWIWQANFYLQNKNYYNAGYYNWNIGKYYNDLGNYTDAEQYLKKSALYYGYARRWDMQSKSNKMLNEVKTKGSLSTTIKKLTDAEKNKVWNVAATYTKEIALVYEKIGDFDNAIQYYQKTAKYWGYASHPEWGMISEMKVEELKNDISLMVREEAVVNYKLGKYEPTNGVYLGMYPGEWLNWNYDTMVSNYGNQAMVLDYANWGDDFHKYGKAEKIKASGSGIQIGFQPMNGLEEVVDGSYIRNWAREAKKLDVPIFLRFACEMNGNWLPWDGNPKLFIEKFRLVHDIMAEEAPNVAMVWSPNFSPTYNIDAYYPGDNYVDWVGMSLYLTPSANGVEHLTDSFSNLVRPIYDKYNNKPFMISESGVVGHSYRNNKTYKKWSEENLYELFNQIPKLFPRIKAITYFNVDGKNQGYDYSLNNNMKTIYNKITKDSLFLRKIEDNQNAKTEKKYISITDSNKLNGKVDVYVENKLTNGEKPVLVALYQDDKKIDVSYGSPWKITVDFSKLNKTSPIVAKAYRSDWTVIGEEKFILKK